MTKNTSTAHRLLRIASYVLAGLAIVQVALAAVFLTSTARLQEIHGWLGMVGILVALAATAAAFWWLRQLGSVGAATAPARSILGHAAGMSVLAIIQVGLGELHLEAVHIMVGILYVLGAVALAVLVSRPARR